LSTHRGGVFITFEGLDGSGKTTQLRLLAGRLRAAGRTVVETAEPGGSRVGLAVREILLDGANQALSPRSELLLYCASRAQNVEEVIRPALVAGNVVLSDRFTDSTLAYQGCARGLGLGTVQDLDRIATGGLKPDITLLLDLDVSASLSRVTEPNRMERQELEFHLQVAAAYRELAALEPRRIRRVDAGQSPGAVAECIWAIVKSHV
jgi:dTMP kinase